MYIAPGQGHTAPRGQSFDVNRNFLSLQSSVASFKSHRWQYFLKNPLFYLFPIQKHKGPNLTLPENRSRSTQGHQLSKFCSTQAPDDVYQDSRSLAFWFRRRRFFLGFYHIWPWRPSWSYDQDHLSKFLFPHNIDAPYEIWLWLAQWFLRRRCLKSVDDDGGLPIL